MFALTKVIYKKKLIQQSYVYLALETQQGSLTKQIKNSTNNVNESSVT